MALLETLKYRHRMEELAGEYGVIMDTGAPKDPRLETLLDEMCRMVPPLYGAAETAEKLGMIVSNLAEKPKRRAPVGMPDAVVRLRSTRLWLASDIDKFAKTFRQRRAQRAAE